MRPQITLLDSRPGQARTVGGRCVRCGRVGEPVAKDQVTWAHTHLSGVSILFYATSLLAFHDLYQTLLGSFTGFKISKLPIELSMSDENILIEFN